MENLDSALLQYVKAEIAKAGANRKTLPSVNLDIMPPAEKRERIAVLEREAAQVKQLTFNLKMAEEIQSIRDLILGISNEADPCYDENEFDATMSISEEIQAEVRYISERPDLTPPTYQAIDENEYHSPRWFDKLVDTKRKIAGLSGVGIITTVIAIGSLPAEFKSWIFPLLNYLGT